jgi:hypothetical protein
MKKIISGWLFTAIITLTSLPTQAQIADQLVPHMGFMREFITAFPANSPNANGTTYGYYNLNFGSYYAIGHVNDIFSYGVDANLQFGILPFVDNGQFKSNYVIQTPVYAMIRLGANATPYNTQRVGISLGIGGGYNRVNEHTSPTQRFKTGYFYPDAVAEFTLMSRGNPITGRFHISLADGNASVRTVDGDGNVLATNDFRFSGLGWGLIYGF